MSQFRSYVAIWTTDPARPEITQQGELLACGPVKDVIETAAHPIPAWVTIAGFADDDTAKKWFESVEDQVDGTALLFPAHPEPVWWPSEREGDRPEWSGRLSPPQERLGVFVSVWADITHLEPFLDYAQHFKWTVEHHGGASLGSGPMPTVLKGGPGPTAMALMAWPTSEAAFAWYDSADYVPYRNNRHTSSNATVVSVAALGLADEGTHR
ncbi:MAG: hypothetical protein JWN52_906 [Actinomycetia bacterium]|nr:hypothetical protein [Actinomycetes bacterium]